MVVKLYQGRIPRGGSVRSVAMSTTYDVAIVGYGPVGQTLAALRAARGHRVAVYERFAALYDLPRAVYFDDEIMQIWQSLGIAEDLDVSAATSSIHVNVAEHKNLRVTSVLP